MAYRTNEPIEVVIWDDPQNPGCRRFRAGPFVSINYPSDETLAKAIAQRFPKATVDGKPLIEAFPCLRAVPAEQLAPPGKAETTVVVNQWKESDEAARAEIAKPAVERKKQDKKPKPVADVPADLLWQ